MVKCYACGKRKKDINFARKPSGRRNTMCKACKNDYNKVWYQKNKKKHKEAAGKNRSRYRSRARRLIGEAKNKPCADCGKKYPYYVMDFDHLPGKKKKFSICRKWSGYASSKRLTRLLVQEISKCEVVCSNCHRIRTHRRRQYTPVVK